MKFYTEEQVNKIAAQSMSFGSYDNSIKPTEILDNEIFKDISNNSIYCNIADFTKLKTSNEKNLNAVRLTNITVFENVVSFSFIKMGQYINLYKKPLLTGYVPSFDPENDPAGRAQDAWRMVFDRFIPEGAVFFLPETIPGWREMTKPVTARFYSAHFCFHFCLDPSSWIRSCRRSCCLG